MRAFIGTSADSESLAELHEVEAQGIYSVRATTGAVFKSLLLPRPVGGVDRTTQRSVVDPGPEQKRHDRDVTMSEAPMESEGAPSIERGTFVPRSSLPDAFGPRTILVAGVDPDVVAESLSQTSLGTVPVAAAPIGPQTGIRVWDALEAAARGDGSKNGWQSQDPRDFPFILISGVQRGEERRHRRTETMAPQWVKDYVERHNLQLMFEEAANAVVKAKAEEPAAFLVTYFQNMQKQAAEALIKGQEVPATEAKVEEPATVEAEAPPAPPEEEAPPAAMEADPTPAPEEAAPEVEAEPVPAEPAPEAPPAIEEAATAPEPAPEPAAAPEPTPEEAPAAPEPEPVAPEP